MTLEELAFYQCSCCQEVIQKGSDAPKRCAECQRMYCEECVYANFNPVTAIICTSCAERFRRN